VWASGNPLVGKRMRLLRYQGPEQRSRKVPPLTAESNTVRVLTPCRSERYIVVAAPARSSNELVRRVRHNSPASLAPHCSSGTPQQGGAEWRFTQRPAAQRRAAPSSRRTESGSGSLPDGCAALGAVVEVGSQVDAAQAHLPSGTVVLVHYGLGAIIVLLVAILIVLIVR